jgi:hypothetical protein
MHSVNDGHFLSKDMALIAIKEKDEMVQVST